MNINIFIVAQNEFDLNSRYKIDRYMYVCSICSMRAFHISQHNMLWKSEQLFVSTQLDWIGSACLGMESKKQIEYQRYASLDCGREREVKENTQEYLYIPFTFLLNCIFQLKY